MVYRLPEPLPWATLATPLAAAEDALARLDQQLATSPIRQGWGARTAFADACASLALQGVGSGWGRNDTLSVCLRGPKIFAGQQDMRPAQRRDVG